LGVNTTMRNAIIPKKSNNPFSHDYAISIGHQPKARTSARIGLGGLI